MDAPAKPTIADPEVTLAWDQLDRPAWTDLFAAAARPALEQSWAYGAALQASTRGHVRRGVLATADRPLALLQVYERRWFGAVRAAQLLRGPVWLSDEIAPAERRAAMQTVRDAFRLSRGELLIWTPELPDAPNVRALMRGLRMRRVVTGYRTVWVDLAQDEAALRSGLLGKWRNLLRRAEESGLRVEAEAGGRELGFLIDRYEAERRRRRYIGPSRRFLEALAEAADPEDLLLLTAYHDGAPVSALLLVRHGQSATYQIGWTGEDGRRLRATNLLLWRAMLRLKSAGVRWLDLGGINGDRAPGVARFKLGVGGEPVALAGTFL